MQNNLHVVVGLGESGFSVLRFLTQHKIPVAVVDTRQKPPKIGDFLELYPHVPIVLGKLDCHLLEDATKIILSPGIAITEPPIQAQIKKGTMVCGDIELFATAVNAPVIAITGTNAKSTVTTLVGEMVAQAGLDVKVGGNLGIAALDLLTIPPPDVYVLELSSFQLETTYSLYPKVATILNVSPDHLDRYDSFADYAAAKQRVYTHCEMAVFNRDDELTYTSIVDEQYKFGFTANTPRGREFGVIDEGEKFLSFEQTKLLSIDALTIPGMHFVANALAAIAIGHAFGLPMEAMLQALKQFKGLPHRCVFVRELKGVKWYNDSKGTNVGASLAAINGLGEVIAGKLILIAGGIGKHADFTQLVGPIQKYVRTVILIGEAAHELYALLKDKVNCVLADTMLDAVEKSQAQAQPADCVLLSPACASMDMFKNFEHRGDVFTDLVRALT